MERVTLDVKVLKNTVSEVEKSIKYTSEKIDENVLKTNKATSKMRELEKENDKLRIEVHNAKEQIHDLTNSHIDLQARSMRDNLIFNGIAETKDEITENVVKLFIKTEMNIKKEINFERVHRMGKKFEGRHRPIVAKVLKA